jgi:hypothetical protein
LPQIHRLVAELIKLCHGVSFVVGLHDGETAVRPASAERGHNASWKWLYQKQALEYKWWFARPAGTAPTGPGELVSNRHFPLARALRVLGALSANIGSYSVRKNTLINLTVR